MDPRAYASGAAGLPPAFPSGTVVGHPRSASVGMAATEPGPWWVYMVGEEVRSVILAGGLAPDPYDPSQMLAAIRAIAARHA